MHWAVLKLCHVIHLNRAVCRKFQSAVRVGTEDKVLVSLNKAYIYRWVWPLHLGCKIYWQVFIVCRGPM